MNENIILTPIIEEVEQSFLDYSVSVITDRALPSAEDGLKPVARRILWDMFDKGYKNDKKFVKCAQPVGDTMGRFHPHGDSSIYGALVWLSQPWNMRYPLIDFHGNNGSRDGDEPAAYRYTECKLSKIGEEMLADIKKDTTDWISAYTDEEDEPVYLPGKIPNLLVNGTTGIAVGMACSFAPHNMNEIMDAAIHIINNPECSIKDLMEFITGPDFPTGGLVINKNELYDAYATGKGRARIRGEYTIESDKYGDKIVFTSIPYKVSKEKLIVDIDQLCENGELNGIVSIRDESNSQGVRFVIELSKGVSASPIIAKLFKKTQLEETYSFNNVALVDKKPRLLNIKQLLENYINHQCDVLIRKSTYELHKAQERAHILLGLLKALEDIDNIIQMIKKSESAAKAKEALQAKYGFSDPQVKAILDMRLAKLANLEQIEIQNEYDAKQKEIEKLTMICQNPDPELVKLFTELKNKYGDARRTTITYIEPPKEEEVFIEPEKCVVVMSKDGLIKRIPTSSFKTQKRNGKGVKTEGDITSAIIRTNTVDSLMVFTNKGKMYRLVVNQIPEGTNTSKGQSIKSLIAMDIDEEPSLIYSLYKQEEQPKYILFVTQNGIVKKTALAEYVDVKRKSGIAAIKLREGDSLVAVQLVNDEDVILLTHNGYAVRFNSLGITSSSRVTVGVKGITLNEGDYIVSALCCRDTNDSLGIFSSVGTGKKISLEEIPTQSRGGKGLIVYKCGSNNGYIVGGALISDEDSLLIIGMNSSICISAVDVPNMGRAATGNSLIKGTSVQAVSKV